MFLKAIPFEGKQKPLNSIFEITSLRDFRKKKNLHLVTSLQKNLNYLLKSLDGQGCDMDLLHEIETQLLKTLPLVEAQRIKCVINRKVNKYKMRKTGRKYEIE